MSPELGSILASVDVAVDRPHVDTSTPTSWAAGILAVLAHYATFGLPSCYAPASQYWFDFWPDLPWNDSADDVVRAMMAHPEYDEIADAFQDKTGLDLRRELRLGLEAEQVALTRQLLQQTSAMVKLGLTPVEYVAVKTNTSIGRAEVLIEMARESANG